MTILQQPSRKTIKICHYMEDGRFSFEGHWPYHRIPQVGQTFMASGMKFQVMDALWIDKVLYMRYKRLTSVW